MLDRSILQRLFSISKKFSTVVFDSTGACRWQIVWRWSHGYLPSSTLTHRRRLMQDMTGCQPWICSEAMVCHSECMTSSSSPRYSSAYLRPRKSSLRVLLWGAFTSMVRLEIMCPSVVAHVRLWHVCTGLQFAAFILFISFVFPTRLVGALPALETSNLPNPLLVIG